MTFPSIAYVFEDQYRIMTPEMIIEALRKGERCEKDSAFLMAYRVYFAAEMALEDKDDAMGLLCHRADFVNVLSEARKSRQRVWENLSDAEKKIANNSVSNRISPYISITVRDVEYWLLGETDSLLICKQGQKYGALDHNGVIVFPFIYGKPLWFRKDLCSTSINDRFGVIDIKGEIIIPFEYKATNRYSDCFVVINDDDKIAIFNFTGTQLTPFLYDGIKPLRGALHIVKNDGLLGLINTETGQSVALCIYDAIKSLESSSLILIKKESLCGIMNEDGKIILPCEYNGISIIKYDKNDMPPDELPFNEFLSLRKGGLFGLATLDGDILFPCDYENVSCDYLSGMIVLGRYGKTVMYRYKDKKVFNNFDWTLEDALPHLEVWHIQPAGSPALIDLNQPNTTDSGVDYIETVTCFQDLKSSFSKQKKNYRIIGIIAWAVFAAIVLLVTGLIRGFNLLLDEFYFIIILTASAIFAALGSAIFSFFEKKAVAKRKSKVSPKMENYLINLARWIYDWKLAEKNARIYG